VLNLHKIFLVQDVSIAILESIQDKYDSLLPYLNEKTRRIWAAIEARSLGWGGVSQVAIAKRCCLAADRNWTIPDYNPCWDKAIVRRFGGRNLE
jgi:hypothetical protein